MSICIYHIAGILIFVVVNIRFLATSLVFVHFIFTFASLAPFYTTVGHTHFVKFRSLDSFLNEKMKIKPHENYLLHGIHIFSMWYLEGMPLQAKMAEVSISFCFIVEPPSIDTPCNR